jgi:hypothetical protein
MSRLQVIRNLLIAPSSFGISLVPLELQHCLPSRPSHPGNLGAKASIYALAVDSQGHMIVSGGPERVIRM